MANEESQRDLDGALQCARRSLHSKLKDKEELTGELLGASRRAFPS